MTDAVARFHEKVDYGGPPAPGRPDLGRCWLWLGALDPRGYGRFDPKPFGTPLAHRIAYWLTHGALDPDLTIDHLCRTPRCVNPFHLEQVTTQENTARTPPEVRIAAHPVGQRQTCAHGHPYRPENTRIDPGGARHCRTCDEEHKAKRAERRRQQRIAKYGYDPGPQARFKPRAYQ